MYTHLTSLKKQTNESPKDNVIKRETILTSQRKSGEIVDDTLIITMILKDLPRYFDPFSIYVTHSNKELTFLEFKTNSTASRKR